MNIILFTVVGAMLLLWGGVLAVVRWIHPVEDRHLYWLGGYLSVVCGVLIFLVIQTAETQQEAALSDTRARLDQQVDIFRKKLGEITDKLFGQVQEKAELTQSEMEVRGDLQTERAEHARTKQELADARKQLQEKKADLAMETAAHQAYLDSLNTARALLQSTRETLQQTEQKLADTRHTLGDVRDHLAQTQERLSTQTNEVKGLRGELAQAEKRLQKAMENASVAQNQLQEKLASQKDALKTLQAAVDSIYMKTLKRPRVPPASK